MEKVNFWKYGVIIAALCWTYQQGTQHFERVGEMKERSRYESVSGSRKYLRPTAEGVGMVADAGFQMAKAIVGGTVKIVGGVADTVRNK